MTTRGSATNLPPSLRQEDAGLPLRHLPGDMPTDAELRMLLMDCVALWGVDARVIVRENGIEIVAADGAYLVQHAPQDMRPVRWLMHRPNRAARVAPSIVALLAALRNALGAEGGNKLRIGAS